MGLLLGATVGVPARCNHFQRHKPNPTGRALHLPTAYARKPILYAVAPNRSHNNLPCCLMAKLLQLCLARHF